jgi:AraC family transcriptional regulator, transcriptional activator of pobA
VEEIIKLESVSQFNTERGQETLHPLVSVLEQSKSTPILETRYRSDLYIVFLKEAKSGRLKYGRNHYDYQDGTLLFIAPGQIFGHTESRVVLQPTGWVLLFHPDLIRGTALGRHIKDYHFFSYDVNEALHVSDREKKIVLESFNKIRYELEHPIDKHSKSLIVSNIELFLNYCIRFYDRQFITRDHIHKDLLVRFEKLLDTYFESDKPRNLGLPAVSYCAGELNISSKYFGDLVKKQTGKTAQEYIRDRVIEVAKEKILDTSKSISEVSFEIGFKYPQHFTRLFKQHVGQSPNEYRLLN